MDKRTTQPDKRTNDYLKIHPPRTKITKFFHQLASQLNDYQQVNFSLENATGCQLLFKPSTVDLLPFFHPVFSAANRVAMGDFCCYCFPDQARESPSSTMVSSVVRHRFHLAGPCHSSSPFISSRKAVTGMCLAMYGPSC